MIVTLRTSKSGELVRELRREAGLTQRQLAERVGRPQALIARWERGGDVPRLDSLVALAAACGVDLDVAFRRRDEIERGDAR